MRGFPGVVVDGARFPARRFHKNSFSKGHIPMTQLSPPQTPTEENTNGAAPQNETEIETVATPAAIAAPETEDEFVARGGAMTIEDYIATSLLRHGRALPWNELADAAEVPLTRATLREAAETLPRVLARGDDFDLQIRVEFGEKPRDEKTRQPLERTVEELLQNVGKPMPIPVIVREVSGLRGVVPAAVQGVLEQLLKTSNHFVEGAPNTWMHVAFFLDSAAPRDDLVRRLNNIESERDWTSVENIEAPASGDLAPRAATVLSSAKRPLPLRVLAYLLWRADNSVETAELFRALSDRKTFYFFTGGFITTQAQKPQWNALAEQWLETLPGAQSGPNLASLLDEEAGEIAALSAADLEKVTEAARAGGETPIALDVIAVEVLGRAAETDEDWQALAPQLRGLNVALRESDAWIEVGDGQFVLRENVPVYIGTMPEMLLPVHLDDEIVLSDEGLEGDCAAFIHDPQWEDVSEEIEAKTLRRADEKAPASTRYVITYPHHVAGTLKLRRMDEAFFDFPDEELSRLPIRATDAEGDHDLGLWASRETGLMYGLVDWYSPQTPSSGAVLQFSRDARGALSVKIGANDASMFLEDERVETLEAFYERAETDSLFDLLQTVFEAHPSGAALATLWAESNVIRRTSKRQLASVLSAHHCFSFKDDAWHFDAEKVAQGFKKNKSKFVRN